ncbi:hypothetical protein FXE50_12000 [Vibrio cholerae]|nr:hypothetical protein FXE50_12000 [Vibrio cholerae]
MLAFNFIHNRIKHIHFFSLAHNARLRGWQRTTTKLKHNSRNHRSSLGLKTPRVDSPSLRRLLAS